MFHLLLVTIDKKVFDGNVVSMTVPGSAGYFQILTNHAPIISSLTSGRLVVVDENNKSTLWAISGGLIEVSHNEVSLLADTIELPSEIDVKRAEASMLKAKKIIDSHQEEADIERAKKAYKRAQNRIKVAVEAKSKTHASH